MIIKDGQIMTTDEIGAAMDAELAKDDAAPMTPTPDKIDTSTLGRMDLASCISSTPIEECVSTWAVDDEEMEAMKDDLRLFQDADDHILEEYARRILTRLKDSSK